MVTAETPRRKYRQKLLSKPRDDALMIPPRRRRRYDLDDASSSSSSDEEEEWTKRRRIPGPTITPKRHTAYISSRKLRSPLLGTVSEKRKRSAGKLAESNKKKRVVSPLVKYTTPTSSLEALVSPKRSAKTIQVSKLSSRLKEATTKKKRKSTERTKSRSTESVKSTVTRRIKTDKTRRERTTKKSTHDLSETHVKQQPSSLLQREPLNSPSSYRMQLQTEPVHGHYLNTGVWNLMERCKVFVCSTTSRHSYRIFQNVKERLRSTRLSTESYRTDWRAKSPELQRLRAERDYWKRRLEIRRSKCHPKLLERMNTK